jgi:hypothetical protein
MPVGKLENRSLRVPSRDREGQLMSEDARNRLRAEVAAIQARLDKEEEEEEEEEEERRQFLQQRAELVQRATEAAGPLTDLAQAFLEAIGRHGNPGLEKVRFEEGFRGRTAILTVFLDTRRAGISPGHGFP